MRAKTGVEPKQTLGVSACDIRSSLGCDQLRAGRLLGWHKEALGSVQEARVFSVKAWTLVHLVCRIEKFMLGC